jgi:uncharacterized protein YndB with AHSA1/START domain
MARTQPEDSGAVIREVRIDASPETVFAFFTDPAKMVRWKGKLAQLDARPGGVYRVDINGTDVARGEFVTIEPPTRVVFTWGWEAEDNPIRPGASTVEVTLTPDGEGTILRLVHRDLPEDAKGAHAEGWDHYLPRLAATAGGSDPGKDPGLQGMEGG